MKRLLLLSCAFVLLLFTLVGTSHSAHAAVSTSARPAWGYVTEFVEPIYDNGTGTQIGSGSIYVDNSGHLYAYASSLYNDGRINHLELHDCDTGNLVTPAISFTSVPYAVTPILYVESECIYAKITVQVLSHNYWGEGYAWAVHGGYF